MGFEVGLAGLRGVSLAGFTERWERGGRRVEGRSYPGERGLPAGFEGWGGES